MSQAQRSAPSSSVSRQHSLLRRSPRLVCLRYAALVGLVAALGCGGEERIDVSPVQGRVVYKGKGAPRATVIFFPEGEAANVLGRMRPFAYCDDDGNFQVKTYVAGDGAPPGEYRVSIVPAIVGRVSKGRTKDARLGADGAPEPQTGVAIPLALSNKYGNVDTSGIKVTIQEGENTLEPFSL